MLASAGPSNTQPVGVVLQHLNHACRDPRYPALAGDWAVGCGPGGHVDRVVDLQTGKAYELPLSFEHPGLGPGVVYEPEVGMVRLPAEQVAVARVLDVLVAPPATDGEHVALLTADRVQAFDPTSRGRRRIAARPAGWYAPALAWPRVAWVSQGEDVLAVDVNGDEVQVLAEGPGHERHVVGSEGWLAWVEDDAVVVLAPDGERTRYPARTGFSAPPTLSGGVACWELRNEADIDVACSDGLLWDGPGDHRWPSRYERWMLIRIDDQPTLFELAAPEPSLP